MKYVIIIFLFIYTLLPLPAVASDEAVDELEWRVRQLETDMRQLQQNLRTCQFDIRSLEQRVRYLEYRVKNTPLPRDSE